MQEDVDAGEGVVEVGVLGSLWEMPSQHGVKINYLAVDGVLSKDSRGAAIPVGHLRLIGRHGSDP